MSDTTRDVILRVKIETDQAAVASVKAVKSEFQGLDASIKQIEKSMDAELKAMSKATAQWEKDQIRSIRERAREEKAAIRERLTMLREDTRAYVAAHNEKERAMARAREAQRLMIIDNERMRKSALEALSGVAMLTRGIILLGGGREGLEKMVMALAAFEGVNQVARGAHRIGRFAGRTAIGGAAIAGAKSLGGSALAGAGSVVGGGMAAGAGVIAGVGAAGLGGALGIDALQNGERSLLPSLMKLKESHERLSRAEQRRAQLLDNLAARDQLSAQNTPLRIQMMRLQNDVEGVGEYSPSQGADFLARRNKQRASDFAGSMGAMARRAEAAGDMNARDGAIQARLGALKEEAGLRRQIFEIEQQQRQVQIQLTRETIEGLKQQQQAHRDLAKQIREEGMTRQERLGSMSPMQQQQLIGLKKKFDADPNSLTEGELQQLDPHLGRGEAGRARGVRMGRGAAAAQHFGIGDEGQAQHADRQAALAQKQIEAKEETIRAVEEEGRRAGEETGIEVGKLMLRWRQEFVAEIARQMEQNDLKSKQEQERNQQAQNQQKGRASVPLGPMGRF